MYDLVIKKAKLIDESIVDIAVHLGKIVEISNNITEQSQHVLDLQAKYYVSAGWIDSHTHCFAHSPIYYDEPDFIGVKSGVTSVVDAGSVGALDVDEFYQLAQQAHTHVYSFLNISKIGLIRQSELADMSDIDVSLFDSMLDKYSNFIIGIKVRMSRSVVGENGILPLIKAKDMQKKSGLPLMIHIGNNPPELDDIADLLTKGDIITHCFNGKPNQIFDKQNNLRDSIKRAIRRGVILDIGHGGESFSFAVADRAKCLDIYPNTISSDIYFKNRIQGPVFSLANVMTKFICLGYSRKRIIDSVTKNAAQILRLKNKGELSIGYDADLTIFDIKQEIVSLSDSEGEVRQSHEQFVPLACVVTASTEHTVRIEITEEGSKNGLRISN
ncbi:MULTISPECIES: amidohydrolase/deacetylase family metallohydrolase [unclassified Gilliamella]|uniref:amidohydrolase/deacetylase family metallohydrolase n=1 Tax=unclassified Gilliamella TaxID=2685620 RepID=UPI0013079E0C|nr:MULTISPECIES: amidohydrolase/deacetylase family metallohydrolase [unclassified Gilliamella]MWP49708.1 amidohydrolase/deacetylase family metallohydrolase [Gilliamella sp. Lep-s35]MWP69456.1 amidohydrolase/deacetylase family metallohydrolase [Gilliamella sp. Lep-s5]MWP77720.1 amidohydrolase/deacetylase family metallohydrolase [Gilliamella sp. Lep-s21]